MNYATFHPPKCPNKTIFSTIKAFKQKHALPKTNMASRWVFGDSYNYYCWWFRNPANQLRLVVYPVIDTGFYTSQLVGLGISEPSTVLPPKTKHRYRRMTGLGTKLFWGIFLSNFRKGVFLSRFSYGLELLVWWLEKNEKRFSKWWWKMVIYHGTLR